MGSCFLLLKSNKGMTEEGLVQSAQAVGEKLYFAGMLDNYEAITKDSLKLAFGTFLSMGILSALPVEKLGTVLQVRRDEAGLREELARISRYRNIPDDYDADHAIELLEDPD